MSYKELVGKVRESIAEEEGLTVPKGRTESTTSIEGTDGVGKLALLKKKRRSADMSEKTAEEKGRSLHKADAEAAVHSELQACVELEGVQRRAVAVAADAALLATLCAGIANQEKLARYRVVREENHAFTRRMLAESYDRRHGLNDTYPSVAVSESKSAVATPTGSPTPTYTAVSGAMSPLTPVSSDPTSTKSRSRGNSTEGFWPTAPKSTPRDKIMSPSTSSAASPRISAADATVPQSGRPRAGAARSSSVGAAQRRASAERPKPQSRGGSRERMRERTPQNVAPRPRKPTGGRQQQQQTRSTSSRDAARSRSAGPQGASDSSKALTVPTKTPRAKDPAEASKAAPGVDPSPQPTSSASLESPPTVPPRRPSMSAGELLKFEDTTRLALQVEKGDAFGALANKCVQRRQTAHRRTLEAAHRTGLQALQVKHAAAVKQLAACLAEKTHDKADAPASALAAEDSNAAPKLTSKQKKKKRAVPEGEGTSASHPGSEPRGDASDVPAVDMKPGAQPSKGRKKKKREKPDAAEGALCEGTPCEASVRHEDPSPTLVPLEAGKKQRKACASSAELAPPSTLLPDIHRSSTVQQAAPEVVPQKKRRRKSSEKADEKEHPAKQQESHCDPSNVLARRTSSPKPPPAEPPVGAMIRVRNLKGRAVFNGRVGRVKRFHDGLACVVLEGEGKKEFTLKPQNYEVLSDADKKALSEGAAHLQPRVHVPAPPGRSHSAEDVSTKAPPEVRRVSEGGGTGAVTVAEDEPPLCSLPFLDLTPARKSK
eukprot:TRINITY_DN11624_c0_g1_i1.p1 TRINITY_DN11624_c0_g1~~TRINITY_DN11624_c0_g1_i1.p1  ORF type:complete len:773 (+),score=165.66 TRINITY_DN11624_c0_g1_i1:85-2403(+)